MVNGDGGVGGRVGLSPRGNLLQLSRFFLNLCISLSHSHRGIERREKMTENERKVGESREAM